MKALSILKTVLAVTATKDATKSKPVFKSVTIWGVVGVFAGPWLIQHGIDIADPEMQQLAMDVSAAAAGLIAVWGRIRVASK